MCLHTHLKQHFPQQVLPEHQWRGLSPCRGSRISPPGRTSSSMNPRPTRGGEQQEVLILQIASDQYRLNTGALRQAIRIRNPLGGRVSTLKSGFRRFRSPRQARWVAGAVGSGRPRYRRASARSAWSREVSIASAGHSAAGRSPSDRSACATRASWRPRWSCPRRASVRGGCQAGPCSSSQYWSVPGRAPTSRNLAELDDLLSAPQPPAAVRRG